MKIARIDLIKNIARAINAVCFLGCEDGADGFRACMPEYCECRKAAKAAVEELETQRIIESAT